MLFITHNEEDVCHLMGRSAIMEPIKCNDGRKCDDGEEKLI